MQGEVEKGEAKGMWRCEVQREVERGGRGKRRWRGGSMQGKVDIGRGGARGGREGGVAKGSWRIEVQRRWREGGMGNGRWRRGSRSKGR